MAYMKSISECNVITFTHIQVIMNYSDVVLDIITLYNEFVKKE